MFTKRAFLSGIIAASAVVAANRLMPVRAIAPGLTTIFVDPRGSDLASGRYGNPIASIEEARRRAKGESDLIVRLSPGKHMCPELVSGNGEMLVAGEPYSSERTELRLSEPRTSIAGLSIKLDNLDIVYGLGSIVGDITFGSGFRYIA